MEIVGLLAKRGRFLVAESPFEPGMKLVIDRDSRARVGDLVLVRARPRGGAKILRNLGRPDRVGDVLEAFMLHRGLRRRFDRAVELEARETRDRLARESVDGRSDLRELVTFTIDPETAQDFDDAISAQRRDDGTIRVWVHIADVSAHVRPGGAVEREARRRATSVYVPGRVEPMLPEALSNDACSLRPHVDRLTVTVRMDVSGDGVVRRRTFARSVVRSDARLTYPEVDAIFAGAAPDPVWAESLAAAREAARWLASRRADALELDNPEPEFAWDGRGDVVGMSAGEQTESHRLIEHLMIAANAEVARHLSQAKLPALFRVHEEPSAEAAQRLVDQLASLGIAVDADGSPAQIVAQCARNVGGPGLTFLVLRALRQAHYAPQDLGHAGLGLEHYCHFTSPIRRYPDLVCHRALLASINAGEELPARDGLEELGAWTSDRERDAMVTERDADRIARCFLLQRELGARGLDAVFDGEVIGVIGAGAFVRFLDGHEGLLPVRALGGGWFELNEEGTILSSDRGDRVAIGDALRIRVAGIDTLRGRVDLVRTD